MGIAHKEGGAHVDSAITDHHRAFVENDGGIGIHINGMPAEVKRFEMAAAWMRQIAHELQRTMETDPKVRPMLGLVGAPGDAG